MAMALGVICFWKQSKSMRKETDMQRQTNTEFLTGLSHNGGNSQFSCTLFSTCAFVATSLLEAQLSTSPVFAPTSLGEAINDESLLCSREISSCRFLISHPSFSRSLLEISLHG